MCDAENVSSEFDTALYQIVACSLLVPPVKLSTVGSRVFSVAGPRVWNTLPEETRSAPSLTIFCQRVKTWLFRQSYPDLIINGLTLK